MTGPAWWMLLLPVALVAGLAIFALIMKWRVETLLPPLGRFIDVPGARLHVVDRGQGADPPVLLIHGLGGQLRHFNYALVDELANQRRVIAVDRPGSGYSSARTAGTRTLRGQVDALAALIDALELERPPVVVGHSLGGLIALALAQQYPQRVAALALIAPLTHAPVVEPKVFDALKGRPDWLLALLAWTAAVPATMAAGPSSLPVIFGPDPVPADFAVRGGGALSLRPSQFIAASSDMAAIRSELPGIAQAYGRMRLPVGVLYGRGDRILDPAEQGSALVSALPGATLVLIEGGHMLPVTAPRMTADFVRAVVARASTPR